VNGGQVKMRAAELWLGRGTRGDEINAAYGSLEQLHVQQNCLCMLKQKSWLCCVASSPYRLFRFFGGSAAHVFHHSSSAHEISPRLAAHGKHQKTI
jgi:hypothetical protein